MGAGRKIGAGAEKPKGGKMTIRGESPIGKRTPYQSENKAVVVAKPLSKAKKGARVLGGKRKRRRKRAKLEEE